jgi:hypothetical protein
MAHRRLGRAAAALGLLGAGALSTDLAVQSPASAATSLTDRLVSTSTAHKLGFPTVANKATQNKKTGTKLCTNGAQVVYQNVPKVTGLIDAIYYCPAAGAAGQFIAQLKTSNTPSTAFAVPTSLGDSAFFSAEIPVYVVFWSRGNYVAAVGFDNAATSDANKQKQYARAPFTQGEETTLTKAILAQDKQLQKP